MGAPRYGFDPHSSMYGQHDPQFDMHDLDLQTSMSSQAFRPPSFDMSDLAMEHRPVRNEGYKPKLCVYCQKMRRKTKAGWLVYSRFSCQFCDVALCTGQRNCFRMYHGLLQSFKSQKDDKAVQEVLSQNYTFQLDRANFTQLDCKNWHTERTFPSNCYEFIKNCLKESLQRVS